MRVNAQQTGFQKVANFAGYGAIDDLSLISHHLLGETTNMLDNVKHLASEGLCVHCFLGDVLDRLGGVKSIWGRH